MTNPETALKAEILLACGALPGVRLFNSPTGEAWQGKVVARDGEMVTLLRPTRVVYGWCPGSSDIGGWRTLPSGVAQLVQLEVKTDTGRLSDGQRRWLAAVQAAGGMAETVRSPEAARALLLGEAAAGCLL